MLRRINFVASGFLVFGALLAPSLAVPRQADAFALSPGSLEQRATRPIASPVHCKPYFHCIKQCRRCARICHRCPSKQ